MKMFYTLLIVGISTVLLATSGTFTNQIALQIHPNSFVNGMAKYQIFALTVGILTTIAILVLNPESRQFLNTGQLSIIAEKEKWLGINGKSSWTVNGLQLLFFISIATGIFMFLAVKHTNSIHHFQWSFIPVILLFSLTNSLTEELIFRFSIVGGLFNHYPKLTLLIISAVVFGLPHYFGNPGGITGMLMSGVLGYILCKATIETKGLSIAWTIHFVQDIIIFTALMMINVRQNTF
ncbi:CPBP family intramembrane metalloprotease [Mariniphaga sediminis]|jgi:membrane protease YdiL (CAAX protease family)|uniref:CPBP family intramembrane metalloprotease n=1 Tax=Mariniphaga sediminis TaxID=1628158 RepID=A0A399CUS3_9BACT|nr:type II CAAX endopeptidase family protein [Mariniphaga sediminis]RIH62868.1 CPBP family intramembrane metalloprotease [Mariniphaga sediminis]